ncbi:MAG: hypothetical protein ACK56F_20945 [bacterium]
MLVRGRLLLSVDAGDPLRVVELGVGLLLEAHLRVHATEVDRAPHFVRVELVRAPVLVAIARLVHALEQGVPRLEAQLPVEYVPVRIPHQEEPVVA